MSRPKNMLVISGNSVYSFMPSNLKKALTEVKGGANLDSTFKALGKCLGVSSLDATEVSMSDVDSLLQRFFPERNLQVAPPPTVSEFDNLEGAEFLPLSSATN